MQSGNPYAFINGEILPADKAFIHVSDLSVQRGYGVFDFFKVREGHPFFLDAYLDRLFHSAMRMHLSIPFSREEIKSVIYQLIERNDPGESGIKVIVTGGYSADGYQPSTPNVIITQHKFLLPAADVLSKGTKVITHEYLRDLPDAKSINYAMGIWLLERMKQSAATDVLYHRNGFVTEFPRCNFFIVDHDDNVITPRENVLRGITRMNVLKLAAQHYKAVERSISLDEAYAAKEAFLTSTTKRIIPVVMIGDNVIGGGKPGKITLSLLDGLKALEEVDLQQRGVHQKS